MFELYDVVIVPLILGVVEMFKREGVSKKLLPFIALVDFLPADYTVVRKVHLKRVTSNRCSFMCNSWILYCMRNGYGIQDISFTKCATIDR